MEFDAASDDAGGDDAGAVDAESIPDNALYLSPTGSDENVGTKVSPFQSFSFALSRLGPGDTLVALPGKYNATSGTGTMNIDCREGSEVCNGAPCPSGTAGAPIVIRAFDERGAELSAEVGMASSNIFVKDCEHYHIEGFTVLGIDDASVPWSSIAIEGSSDLVLRRNLVVGSNRMVNGHAVQVDGCSDVLVEENEVYDFHRVAIANYKSSRVTVRRNYVNARSYPDLATGYTSLNATSGDVAFTCSHSVDCLFENNIVEGDTMDGVQLAPASDSPNPLPGAGDEARYLGNVFSGQSRFGIFFGSNCEPSVSCEDKFIVENSLIRDNLIFDAPSHGIFVRGAKGLVIDHNTLVDSDVRIDLSTSNVDMAASVAITNTLAAGPQEYGITVLDQDVWSIDYSTSQGSVLGFFTDGDLTGIGANNVQVGPQLAGCLHRIPTSSPLSGAGIGGTDIGATIVSRYEDGTLTGQPLWDLTSGTFPCGAAIPGLNDTGSVCTSVHTRLGVGSECPVE